MRICFFAASLFLAGCTTAGTAVDRMRLTDFYPYSSTTFSYAGLASLQQPIDTEAGEQARMDTLKAWLRENDMCRDGFEITSKKLVRQNTGLFADIYKVYYTGRCKGSGGESNGEGQTL